MSAFAPIANPTECPWGKKAFAGYLGSNPDDWALWDATHLVSQYESTRRSSSSTKVQQTTSLAGKQLLPENLLAAADGNDHIQTIFKQREGYDHSYFYIATFVAEHIAYHAALLTASA